MQRYARALSLVLALSIVVGGWLLFEYGSRPAAAPDSVASTLPAQTDRRRAEASAMPASVAQAPPAPAVQRETSFVYKCDKGGRVRFGDQPCGGDEKTLSVSATTVSGPAVPDPSIARMKAAAAEMEASRLERERRYAAANLDVQRTQNRLANDARAKEARCRQIDLEIANVDARLRMPYPAPFGDYLAGARRKLTDDRFSAGC